MDNYQFNAWLKSLPKKEKVVGQLADGTPLVVEVPDFGSED